ncbi:hypothetical protein HDU76_006599 [Blyttiomyces sp. JEL0837]|nr:hypothetical protein HDU76_006599 [Blyttiomyces sp. JEL0837]
MDPIRVFVRLRPLNSPEPNHAWHVTENTITCAAGPDKALTSLSFSFDRVFDTNSITKEVFDASASDLVKSCLEGINGTIFAYGQTSSGKTHTMHGSEKEPGIIFMAAQDIFERINSMQSESSFKVTVSYLEIYNEIVKDLLNSKSESQSLKIHEHHTRGVFVGGLTEYIVADLDDVKKVVAKGELNRHVGETNMNEKSSRSHTILRFMVEIRENKFSEHEKHLKMSYLNLVDLAGSERAGHTGAEGIRLKEGGLINKSLLALATVIGKLSDGGDKRHIPYRDSKITRILQPSLGGNARTSIICTVTPSIRFVDETLSTLKFAGRAKSIQNQPTVNEIVSHDLKLKNYQREIESLQTQLHQSFPKLRLEREQSFVASLADEKIRLAESVLNSSPMRAATPYSLDFGGFDYDELLDLRRSLKMFKRQAAKANEAVGKMRKDFCLQQTLSEERRSLLLGQDNRILEQCKQRIKELEDGLNAASSSAQREKTRAVIMITKLQSIADQVCGFDAQTPTLTEVSTADESVLETLLDQLFDKMLTMLKEAHDKEISRVLSEAEAIQEEERAGWKSQLSGVESKLEEALATNDVRTCELRNLTSVLEGTQKKVEEARSTNNTLSGELQDVNLALEEARQRINEQELQASALTAATENERARNKQLIGKLNAWLIQIAGSSKRQVATDFKGFGTFTDDTSVDEYLDNCFHILGVVMREAYDAEASQWWHLCTWLLKIDNSAFKQVENAISAKSRQFEESQAQWIKHISELEVRLQDTSAQNSIKNEELQSARDALEEVYQRLEKQDNVISELQADARQNQEKLESERRKNAKLQKTEESLTEEVSRLVDQIKALELEKGDMQQRMKESLRKQSSKSNEAGQYEAMLVQMQNSMGQLQSSLTFLKGERESLQRQNQKLVETLHAQQQLLEDLKAENEFLHNQNHDLESTSSELKHMLQERVVFNEEPVIVAPKSVNHDPTDDEAQPISLLSEIEDRRMSAETQLEQTKHKMERLHQDNLQLHYSLNMAKSQIAFLQRKTSTDAEEKIAKQNQIISELSSELKAALAKKCDHEHLSFSPEWASQDTAPESFTNALLMHNHELMSLYRSLSDENRSLRILRVDELEMRFKACAQRTKMDMSNVHVKPSLRNEEAQAVSPTKTKPKTSEAAALELFPENMPDTFPVRRKNVPLASSDFENRAAQPNVNDSKVAPKQSDQVKTSRAQPKKIDLVGKENNQGAECTQQ